MKKWKTLDSVVVHDNPWYQIRKDDVIRPNGSAGTFFVLSYKPVDSYRGVMVVPVTNDKKIVMVKMLRYISSDPHWELPAGGSSEEDGSILVTARRELQEETGFLANKTEQLFGEYLQVVGCSEMLGNVVLASDLKSTNESDFSEEGISEVASFSVEEVDEMIISGEIVDAQTISALYFYKLYVSRQDREL